ncbi:hypothetical protein [uncultured Desulfosarcina sp.]|uniref:hypothetical protein n=1 Tax=uncultured Desulfosarcina sp. TaxID=218289 RepID=UPI0029C890CC|nr:hypothetical protein [uncultured Desulfosarcina sp.]
MIYVEKEENRTIFKVTGDVTANEIMMQVVQYVDGEPTDTVLWNFTDASKVKITTMEMKGIADSLKKTATDRTTRKVALVGSKSINLGLGKLFVAFAQLAGLQGTYQAFRDMNHAIEWLEDSSNDQ